MSNIIEKGIPEELLNKGYWFRASCEHIYIVTLEYNYSKLDGEINNIIATASEVDTNYLTDVNINDLRDYEEVVYFACCDPVDDWFLKIDIWAKYFFPTFNNEKNQFYHQEQNCCNYINSFNKIFKATYDIAMKESKLKTY